MYIAYLLIYFLEERNPESKYEKLLIIMIHVESSRSIVLRLFSLP